MTTTGYTAITIIFMLSMLYTFVMSIYKNESHMDDENWTPINPYRHMVMLWALYTVLIASIILTNGGA